MVSMNIIFQSKAMQEVLATAQRYAASSATVLIYGESGTGKELVARYIHDSSPRAERNYRTINCAAVSSSLAESELFGHEQGSFTSAERRHSGHFESAGDGTLFLDEIGELSLAIQAKLLRVLESNEFYRVGGTQCCELKSRVIAATNRDLSEQVAKLTFREDLLHRLEVLPLKIPPLRDRPRDIPALVSHFLNMFAGESQLVIDGVSREVMDQFYAYAWPGNIRQLRNVIHRACVLADSRIINECPLPETEQSTDSSTLTHQFQSLPLEDIEKHIILDRLDQFDGNKTAAAAALGVSSRTLRNKMARYRSDNKAA